MGLRQIIPIVPHPIVITLENLLSAADKKHTVLAKCLYRFHMICNLQSFAMEAALKHEFVCLLDAQDSK
jgi:hypothetical protein